MPKTRVPALLLRIELADIEPVIWRHLLVPPGITLPHLHQALQAALGWHDMHLHEFHIQGATYGVPDTDGPPLNDEAGVTLAHALGTASTFSYVYDMGDEWEHQISVMSYLPSNPPAELPRCLDGANAGPPEDAGGPGGYSHFVEAMADPLHPEHEAVLDWHGQPFDASTWDIDRVNKRLKRLRHTWDRDDLNER